MGGKRGNEHSQTSKESFDLIQDANGEEMKQGIRKASESIMRQRRIVRPSRKGQWAQKSKASTQEKTGSLNLFANKGSTNPLAKTGSANPFANTTIVPSPSSSTTAPKSKSYNTSSNAKKQAPANPFAAVTLTSAPNAFNGSKPTSSMESATSATKSVMTKFPCKGDKLNWTFLNFIDSDSQNNEFCDWEDQTSKYLEYSESVDTKEKIALGGNKTSADNTSASKTINFGSTFSTPQVGSSATPPFSGFSLRGKPAPTTTPLKTADASAQDEDSFPEEKPDEALRENNPDEECVYEVKAKYYKRGNNEWKNHGTGNLRINVHKTLSKKRLVMRNTVGKVQLNVALHQGMQLQQVPNKKLGGVQFYAKLEDGRDRKSVV